MIHDHYQLAWDWLNFSKQDYYHFNSIFPLWHRGSIEIDIEGDELKINNMSDRGDEYEAYNRLITKEGKLESYEWPANPDITELILQNTTKKATSFKVNFNPKLVSKLSERLSPVFSQIHHLPESWEFDQFSLKEYKKVFTTIQVMMSAWFVARLHLASNNMAEFGYRSSVWLPQKDELLYRLKRYTSLDVNKINEILKLITFGSAGIRDPDIATQPLVDMANGCYALAPFIWINTDCERNLCVLLNQIPKQRKIYSDLKNQKESILKEEIKAFLSFLNLDFKDGKIEGTNLDIAIIDRKTKFCLCLELKWFIEPAEIREVDERTDELKTAVSQAKKILELYNAGDTRLIQTILEIDSSYSFFVAVGSQNWIGYSDAQDKEIPIIKLWHLINKIKESNSLEKAIRWLFKREYLPKRGEDFDIFTFPIKCGKWHSTWYGIKPF